MNNRIIIIAFLITCFSCKQVIKSTIQETYFPTLGNNYEEIVSKKFEDSLENGNWQYLKEDNLVKKGKYEDGYKIGLWDYNINNKIFKVFWETYNTGSLKINYPKNWSLRNIDNYLFYMTGIENTEDFFLLNKYNKAEFNINLDDYLKEAIIELNKKEEKVINYICIKLKSSSNRSAYYFRFDTKLNEEKSSYYAFYTEDDFFIYDCTLKINGQAKIINKEIFSAMIYSLAIDGNKLFYNNDSIISSSNVTIEDFN